MSCGTGRDSLVAVVNVRCVGRIYARSPVRLPAVPLSQATTLLAKTLFVAHHSCLSCALAGVMPTKSSNRHRRIQIRSQSKTTTTTSAVDSRRIYRLTGNPVE